MSLRTEIEIFRPCLPFRITIEGNPIKMHSFTTLFKTRLIFKLCLYIN